MPKQQQHSDIIRAQFAAIMQRNGLIQPRLSYAERVAQGMAEFDRKRREGQRYGRN